MLCIGMFLFSYVNASMFWHGHHAQGNWFFHSHIADKAHRTAHTDGGHTAAQFLLLETLNQVSYTEAAVPAFDLEPLLAPAAVILTLPAAYESRVPAFHFSLRGPPALV